MPLNARHRLPERVKALPDFVDLAAKIGMIARIVSTQLVEIVARLVKTGGGISTQLVDRGSCLAEVFACVGSQFVGDPLLMPDNTQKPESQGKQLRDFEFTYKRILANFN